MHFQGLNLNLLVSLDALLSEKSVTRAAERVNVTQPAMSASLQQLRDYLSDPLLQRVGRTLELTPRARELAVAVKELLLRIDTVLNADQAFDPKTAKRTFRIAMSANMAELLGVPLIRYLMDNAAGVALHVLDLATDSLRRVEEGDLDFCITLFERALSNPPHRPEILSSEHLYTDRFVLVAAKGNAVVNDELSYEAFCKLPYVELRLSGNFMSVPEVILERQPHRPPVSAWMPTPHLVLAAVSASDAVAILPSRLFELHSKNLQLRSISPPFALPTIDQKCFWHPRNDIDAGHSWLRETLKSLAANSSGEDGNSVHLTSAEAKRRSTAV